MVCSFLGLIEKRPSNTGLLVAYDEEGYNNSSNDERDADNEARDRAFWTRSDGLGDFDCNYDRGSEGDRNSKSLQIELLASTRHEYLLDYPPHPSRVTIHTMRCGSIWPQCYQIRTFPLRLSQ